MSWKRKASWRPRSTSSSHTACSKPPYYVRFTFVTPRCRTKPLTATGLQQEQPQLYENLTKALTPEEQQVIQGAIVQADQIAAAEAEALAALAQAQSQTAVGGQQGNGHIGL